jgi:hypothetical protein
MARHIGDAAPFLTHCSDFLGVSGRKPKVLSFYLDEVQRQQIAIHLSGGERQRTCSWTGSNQESC